MAAHLVKYIRYAFPVFFCRVPLIFDALTVSCLVSCLVSGRTTSWLRRPGYRFRVLALGAGQGIRSFTPDQGSSYEMKSGKSELRLLAQWALATPMLLCALVTKHCVSCCAVLCAGLSMAITLASVLLVTQRLTLTTLLMMRKP